MKLIHYAGDVLVTGDALADAVIQYAQTLARHETSASIDIPVVNDKGLSTQASLLLGPASQIVALGVQSRFPDPEHPEIVNFIAAQCARLDGVQIEASDELDISEDDFDY